MTLYDFYHTEDWSLRWTVFDAEISKGQDDPIYEYDKILYSNQSRKLRHRQHRRVNALHHVSDRNHGKPRQLTRKQELSMDYFWHMVGDNVIVAYRGKNKRKDYIPKEYRV